MSDGDHPIDSSSIPIVGMARRVPGARNLAGGVESIRDVSTEELRAAGVSAETMRRRNYVRRTADLEGFADFDAGFFGFSPKEAAIMDPQHRQYFLARADRDRGDHQEPALSRRSEIARWGWRPAWKQAYADAPLKEITGRLSFLIFLDDAGLGAEVRERLRARGHVVTTVHAGDAFGERGEGEFVLCPEHGPEGYEQLFRRLSEIGPLPDRIVHLWLLTADEACRPGSSFYNRKQERGFHSVVNMAQALAGASVPERMQLTVLTNGAQRVGDEALPYPEKATVLGPALVLPREMPGVSVRVIDAALLPAAGRLCFLRLFPGNERAPDSRESLIELLVEDILANAATEVVAYRRGRRFVRTEVETELAEPAHGAAMLKEKGVYIVSGGLGGLGAACAEQLAASVRARLVLLGRTELPDRADWDRYVAAYGAEDRVGRAIIAIRGIEAAGGEVLYVRADVTNPEAVRGAVATAKARFGAIDGVFHAAGTVKDGLIALKSQTEMEEVLGPKVLGALVLDEALAGEPLDLFVLFSSTSTDIALPGQSDYAAANAFLNAFAASRAGSGSTRYVAIHWGVWNEVGLAARAVGASEEMCHYEVASVRAALIERRCRGGTGGELLELSADPARHWALGEHRLASGESIWPGTGYLELAAEAAREMGIGGAFEIGDLMFLRPLHVADGSTRRLRLHTQHSGGGAHVAVLGQSGSGWVTFAEGRIQSLRNNSEPRLDLPALRARIKSTSIAGRGQALASSQEAHLQFGPRWKVLRSMGMGHREAIALLSLDSCFAGDLDAGYLLHPALLDIATGYAMALIDGYNAEDGFCCRCPTARCACNPACRRRSGAMSHSMRQPILVLAMPPSTLRSAMPMAASSWRWSASL